MIPLYEAIALSTYGCALGRAVDAVGKTRFMYEQTNGSGFGDYQMARDLWRWLRRRNSACPFCHQTGRVKSAYTLIIHVWDCHYVDGHGNLSLDQFLDWVKSIDPTLKHDEAEPPTASAEDAATAELITV